MSFAKFRPQSHFISPHSWMNDPCGAVYIPETKEYLFCYQWNPGTTEGGNSAWGMAKSKDLVTWEDCSPALRNGDSYDRLGVFSGSIVSRIIEGRRVLFLFYTSISALPLHWSKDYIKGCESQSVAFSTDFGTSWHRYENNPLMKSPPAGTATTGWRDPFVSPWEGLSKLIGNDVSTDYMMIASGEKGKGPQLHLYQSQNLLDWELTSTILSVEANSKITPTSSLNFGMNFECASFFSIGERHYIIVGVEEDNNSLSHNGHHLIWLSGNLVLEKEKPKFVVTSHGQLDHGISYAAHIFRDSEGRLIQLGWADEAAKQKVVSAQGWAGCLPHPRELCEISRPIDRSLRDSDIWSFDETSGMMTTLGLRPAPQVQSLHNSARQQSLERFPAIRSKNFAFEATFSKPSADDLFTFNVRECPNSAEVTKINFDIRQGEISIDRSRSSLENIGTTTSDSGVFDLLPGEDLSIRVFVDNSIIEVYANDRFALTSRIYPTLESSKGVSYNFGRFDEQKMKLWYCDGMRNAWPRRELESSSLDVTPEAIGEKLAMTVTESRIDNVVYA